MWPRPPVTERRDPDGHQTRVGYILRRFGAERHCSAVTRVCLARGGRHGEAATVVTASRDGTLKCWDVPASNETRGGASSSTSVPTAQLRCSLEEHTGWVNDCVVLPTVPGSASAARDSLRLLSASNDNLVKIWQVEEERQGAGVSAALLSLRYHIDYVTCLAYAPHRALLASAGLDARCIVSDLEAATRVVTLQNSDASQEAYVNGTGSNSARSGVGAGGSGGRSGQTSAQRCAVGQFTGSGQYIPHLLTASGSQSGSHGYDGRSGALEHEGGAGSGGASYWSVAMTRHASLIACGTASCVIRGWDPRTGTRLWRLRGHTENVRALVLSDDGTMCISGSTDRTVRVWDLGMRRCVHVFDAHHDSVWSLALAGHSCGYAAQGGSDTGGAGGGISEIFSGGRDGMLLVHDLRQMQTGIVVRESSALQAIAVPVDARDVWASAADSHVRHHSVPVTLVPYGGLPQPPPELVRPPGAAPLSPVVTWPPPAPETSIIIPGVPRLTDFKVFDNKRQVLARDACERYMLWDVTTGTCVDIPPSSLPKDLKETSAPPGSAKAAEESMEHAFKHLNRPVSMPSWFSCDIALGSLSVYLDVAQCFKAESDEADVTLLGLPARLGGRYGGADMPVHGATLNSGLRTLRALFDGWVRSPVNGVGRVAPQSDRAAAERGGAVQRSQSPTTRGRIGNSSRPRVFLAPPALQDAGGKRRWDEDQPPGTPADQQQGDAHEAPTLPGCGPSSAFPPATALVLVSRSGRPVGYRGRLYCGLFSGVESPDLLPPWVVDVVWNQRPPPEDVCGERVLLFTVLRCSSEIALPSLPTPFCVAAPRARVHRLMAHLIRVLDFDWSAPPKAAARRPSSAGGLVSRLGRCCVAPTSGRGAHRSPSSDSWGSQSDTGDGPPSNGHAGGHTGGGRSGVSKRSRSTARDRSASAGPRSSGVRHAGGGRRTFGLRGRSDDDASAGRVRIDGSPAPLPSVLARQQAPAPSRRGASRERGVGSTAAVAAAPASGGPGAAGSGVASPAAGGSGGMNTQNAAAGPPESILPDERFVEIVCNGTVVDPEMSLATVRDFIWKNPGVELVLNYRRSARAMLPPVSPPPPPLLGNSGKDSGATTTPLAAAVMNGPVALGNSRDDRAPEAGSLPKE